MKILIVSDTHRRYDNLIEVLEHVQPIDLLIHLGDAEGEEDYIAGLAGCRVEVVAGNYDFFSALPKEKELQLGGHHIFLTHGHSYCVGMEAEDIKKEAESRNCDIAMFGHTHKPFIAYGKRTVTLNPGSISYPRQEGKRPSYIVMDIDRNNNVHFEIEYL